MIMAMAVVTCRLCVEVVYRSYVTPFRTQYQSKLICDFVSQRKSQSPHVFKAHYIPYILLNLLRRSGGLCVAVGARNPSQGSESKGTNLLLVPPVRFIDLSIHKARINNDSASLGLVNDSVEGLHDQAHTIH